MIDGGIYEHDGRKLFGSGREVSPRRVPKRLRILSCVSNEPTPFDGKYVKAYDPTFHNADGSYDGGILEVTDDPAKAMQFADAGAALEKWRQPAGCECHGVRADGRPNAPLTAWHCEVS